MKFVEGCPECQRVSDLYETATIEWFRVQNQLGIAEHLRDSAASADIVAELAEIAKRRQSLRDEAAHHLAQGHPARVFSAC